MYLVYQTEEEFYQAEKERVKGLVTGNEEIERRLIFIQNNAKYPGYVLSYTLDCREYVLFNDEENQVICVYL